ncbi:hypothetical protein FNV43_RR20964 [Rhamnella rubrinervis]|uniref:Uncharacterized protein n=1 Tax=Rhamnella rubrinervis TaxID=2594499 RepID=A0A8K0GTX2_9ROSA|nr:hypothetical protein FNV43_RR20964 [Rhamnella rubrinervis]
MGAAMRLGRMWSGESGPPVDFERGPIADAVAAQAGCSHAVEASSPRSCRDEDGELCGEAEETGGGQAILAMQIVKCDLGIEAKD